MRHHLAHKLMGVVISLFAIDHDLTDVLTKVVTDRTDDEVALLVDQEGGRLFFAGDVNG